jgi:hypothetical protein
MFGSAFLSPSGCNTTSTWVAIATNRALVLSVLNLEKVVWQGGFWIETQCDQLCGAALRQ